jgi:nitrous oxidase accessory protein
MTQPTIIRWLCGIAAAGLVGLGSTLPVWTMTMKAPQYPKGLRLIARGTGMSGDVSELNILNHYIGMPPLQAPEFETTVFPFAIAALVVLCLLSPIHRWLRRAAILAVAVAPVAALADLQWRLYEFGHSLNPEAPIRLAAFTPLVIGTTKMGNFTSWAMASWGIWCLVAAAALLVAADPLSRRLSLGRKPARAAVAAVTVMVALMAVVDGRQATEHQSLQQLVDAAPRGSTLLVPQGMYAGPVLIAGPLTVVAPSGATVDGRGHGSVITVTGSKVQLRGFTVRNSGRDVTEEAAGIKVSGSGHVIEDNRIEDVYFGIHLGDGDHVTVRNNVIIPGEHHGARPGHGISAWNVRDSVLSGNRIQHARDGIYLSFTNRVTVSGNTVSRCRYGLHSMYSENAVFDSNEVTANLLGAALMSSDRLTFSRNRIAHHRDGSAAYGILLKDIGDLTAEGNAILSNRVGVYAEGVPSNPSRTAVLTGNLIAGNEVGLALQSTAALVVSGNRIAENLSDVRALGRRLSDGMQWSRDGRGNSWGRYQGYDANRDGVGDVPFQLDDAIDGLLQKNPAIQAFLYTPAHAAIESAVRMFPIYRQPPVLVDRHPLMRNPAGALK